MEYYFTKNCYKVYRRELIQAFIFSLFLLLSFLLMCLLAFSAYGPIILGTEMNTNGLVEYLCLGAGCDDLTAMDW